jgi:membrane protease subunit HflK
MTTGKSAIQADVKAKIADELNEQNIGLQIVNITIQDAAPPTNEIMSAFKAVETAKQTADTTINQAKKYANEKIPEAEAESDRIQQNAEAQKESRIAEAEGQVARFNAMYEQYAQNPLITKQRMFYETLEALLPGVKVIITDGGTETMMPIESFATIGDSVGLYYIG